MMRKIIIVSFFLLYSLFLDSFYYQDACNIVFLSALLEKRQDVKYIHLHDSFGLTCKCFCEKKDNIKFIQYPENFVLSIPNGQILSQQGLVVVDGMYLDELIWGPIKKGLFQLCSIAKDDRPEVIHGKIAVGLQAGAWNYYHWMTEILPRLRLLQESGIDFDYLYIPVDYQFMKETLDILGFDKSKIIEPEDNNFYIQADELIVSSMLHVQGHLSPFVIDFLRNTFMPLSEKNIDASIFSKRIFISRSRAKKRKIINEDQVFELFKKHGFVRYHLEDLSVLEQVTLFSHAEIIVGEHGAGLTNIVFATPGTKVIEIFQDKKRVMFWNLSQRLGLYHICVKTIEYNTRQNERLFSTVPLKPIKDAINRYIK